MDAFKLTQIAVFNPQRLDDKTAKALFVVRTKLFQLLINELKEETKNSIAQNHLIIGARGMGKTTLLKRIQIEIKESDLYTIFIPILYQEEQYNIANLNDLWLNSLDKLADFVERLGKKKLVTEIDTKIAELNTIKNNQDAKIYNVFMDFCAKLNKRPVLLLDNISLLFNRLDKDEQHSLRKILIEKKAPILIAANPSKVTEVLEYGAPFYDAFQIHYIDKLSNEELFVVLNNLIKLTKSEDLTLSLQQNQARIKVINKLTGGNPRTAVMLFKLIVKGFSENLKDDLDAILDEVTPLYKARFEEELPQQAQIIMNAIANHWHPISLKEISNITALPNNKLQPQLNRLLVAGWLEKNKLKGKNTLYEINERFFNFWYLMRQSNRRDKKQITYLSYFLESLYTNETLQANAKLLLNKEASNSKQILTQLAVAQSVTPLLKKQLISNAKENIQHLTNRKEKQRLQKLVDDLEQPTTTKTDPTALQLGIEYLEKNDFSNAEKSFKKVLENNPKDETAWYGLGYLYQVHLNKYKEAKNAYKKALESNPKSEYAWNGLGNLYQDHLNKYIEAEKAYKKALEIIPNSLVIKHNLVFLYRDKLNKIEKAKELFYSIKDYKNLKDTYYLHQSLFALYDTNEQEAKTAIEKALAQIENRLPLETQGDWWRFAAIAIRLNYTTWLLEILKSKGYDIILNPYFEAIKLFTLQESEKENYLSTKALEIRETTYLVYYKIKEYM